MIGKTTFGRTGHLSTRIILGAAAFYSASQEDTDEAMELALSYGINHVDVAASYGEAELRLGSWIGRHGRPFFLATKTGERTAVKAREQFHRSLERLKVDQVDLLQLHNLVDPQEWEVALGPEGALEAAIEAQREGLVRFIGVTGHGLATPSMHRRALERFDFDSVLLPHSYILWQNAQYRADVQDLLTVCRTRGTAVQTIKAVVQTPWGECPKTHNTWYKPMTDQAEIDLAVHWVLAQEGLFLNTAADIRTLRQTLEAATRFSKAPEVSEMQAQLARLDMKPLFE